MKNQIQDVSYKTNKASVISLVAGIIAIMPYLIWTFGYLLSNNYLNDLMETIGFILMGIMVVWFLFPSFIVGLVFGPISLITGSIAILQIKNRQGVETGYRLAIVGILLGVLGLVANLLFYYYLILGLLMRD